MNRASLALLFSFSFFGFAQEYTAPLLHNQSLSSTEQSTTDRAAEGTFDSTFVYTLGTLSITDLFDDFSSDKFVDYNVGYGDAGVTSTLYYHLMNDAGTMPLDPSTVLCDSSKAHRIEVSVFGGVPTTDTIWDFTEVNIQRNILAEYPVSTQSRTLFAECFVRIDTLIEGAPDISPDTVFNETFTEFIQDSARIFFADMNDNSKIWADNQACRNYGLAYQPWSLGVVTLDGVDETGWPYDIGNPSAYGTADYLTSKPINMAGLTDVYIDFIYQAQGNCDAPEEQDSLVLQYYYVTEDKWINSGWSTPGDKPFDQWDTVHYPVPAFMLLNGFKFRFYNKASTSGWLDHWHIDYVRVRDNQLPGPINFNDLAISEPPHTLLQDYVSVPWDHFKNITPSDKMLDEVVLNGYNCDNTASGQIPGAFQVDFMGVTDGGPYSIGVTSAWSVGITPYPVPIVSNYSYDNTITTDPQATFDVKMNIATDGAIASKNSFPDNDTTYFQQVFKNYYAYDDGSAELAYGVTGNRSLLAYKFEAYEADTLTGILMSFVPTVEDLSGNIFLLTIWADDGGEPGEILYQDDFFSPHYPDYVGEKNGFEYYTFADGVGVVVPETFYVGWDQIEDERLNIGLDMNIPNNDKIFYNTAGTWQTSSFEGSLLIRPVFSTALNYTLHNPEQTFTSEISIYPNPSTGIFTIDGVNQETFLTEVYDMSGRLIYADLNAREIDLTSFEKGVYIVQIKEENGNLIDTKKVTKL